MAQMLLVMGESGTGKSTSMRNCDPATTAVVNPVGKPLPFKGKFEMLNSETESRKICKFMKEQAAAGKKLIVVDDFQYILSVPYMNRIKENGWDKWNDFGANYFEIIEVCKELPEDVVVAYMTHTETLDNGVTTIKLIGKLLREKITIEGLFTIVLRNLIAFNNGIYDLVTGELKPFSTDIVITNKIPWDYNPDAYFELADKTLNKLACDDVAIRALLEECIGYCFYRRNELGKAFILTGDKNNGKSTFLDIVKTILGDKNISALDLKELGDRFNTSMMFGKMANIGDDIGDDFLQGSQVSIFKKIVTGNRIKAERKGQDPFEFNPFIKLLFSANDIPRMKDKTGAVLRRLVIIPFNARFSKYLPDGVTIDPDFDPFIKYKLIQKESIEYLIKLGVEGLKRVITNNEFTKSEKVQGQLDEYEEENNPIIAFIADCGVDMIENEPTADVYKRYQVFCAENSMQPMSNIVFSKQINKRLGFKVIQKKLNNVNPKIFVKEFDYKLRVLNRKGRCRMCQRKYKYLNCLAV